LVWTRRSLLFAASSTSPISLTVTFAVEESPVSSVSPIASLALLPILSPSILTAPNPSTANEDTGLGRGDRETTYRPIVTATRSTAATAATRYQLKVKPNGEAFGSTMGLRDRSSRIASISLHSS